MSESIDLTDLLRQYVQIQWFEIVDRTVEHLSQLEIGQTEETGGSVPGLLTARYPNGLFRLSWRSVPVEPELAEAALRKHSSASNSHLELRGTNRVRLPERVLDTDKAQLDALSSMGSVLDGTQPESAIERIRHEEGALAGAVYEHLTRDIGNLDAILFGLYAEDYFVWEVFREVDGVSVQEAIRRIEEDQQRT